MQNKSKKEKKGKKQNYLQYSKNALKKKLKNKKF